MTREYLLNLFEYRDGNLYWKVSKAHRIKIGDVAGSINKDGYSHVYIDNRVYKLHRIIFLMHYGYVPEFIDHIDRNRRNNSIENLREATKSQNCINKKLQSNNTSGYRGVCWHKRIKRWSAIININKKKKHIGFFLNKEDAYNAYKVAAKIHYGQFSNI